MKRLLLVLALLSSSAALAVDGTVIQVQNAGSTIATLSKFIKLNCSTGLTCTLANGTIVLTSGGALNPPVTATQSADGTDMITLKLCSGCTTGTFLKGVTFGNTVLFTINADGSVSFTAAGAALTQVGIAAPGAPANGTGAIFYSSTFKRWLDYAQDTGSAVALAHWGCTSTGGITIAGATQDSTLNRETCLAGNSSNVAILTEDASGNGSWTSITSSRGQVFAGPSAYGAAAAAASPRVLVAQDVPPGYGQCATLDSAICASSVDANGVPNYIAAGTGGAVTVTGTGWSGFIQGQYQTMTGTYTNVVTGTTSSFNYLYVKQDTSNANIVAADFGKTVLAPNYGYKAPTACTGATGSDPQYWYDLGSRQWKVSTAAACSFSVASPQVLFLGVFWVTATPTVSGVAHEPFNLSPFKRVELFGGGFDTLNGGTDITKQELTSGTTTIDNFHSYTSFEMTGATVNPTAWATSGATIGATIAWSQNPVLIVNTSVLSASGKGRTGGGTSTGVCNTANAGGYGGSGGGGGGAGGTTNAGCAGGNRTSFATPAASGAGTAGATGATGTAGGNGTSTPTLSAPILPPYFQLSGAGGGGGGGDGAAHNSGGGGSGGGTIVVRAPSIVEDASSSITADGNNGTNATANSGGGGGGGGGFALVQGLHSTISGTLTAAAGTGGTNGGGTGAAGGNGTVGITQKDRLVY